MDNKLPTCMYFEVNEMGNKEFSWSGLRIDHPELEEKLQRLIFSLTTLVFIVVHVFDQTHNSLLATSHQVSLLVGYHVQVLVITLQLSLPSYH